MKKFKTDDLTGIVPLVLNDISFLQDATTEMIEAFVKMICELTSVESFILSGFVQYGAPLRLSDGWLVLNGKIYKFDDSLLGVTMQGQHLVLRVSENILASGEKIMKPGLTTVNTYYDYKAILVAVTNDLSGDVHYTGLKRFEDIINDINALSSNWVNLTLTNDWEADTSGGCAAPSYKLKNNVVYLRGRAIKTGSSAIITSLPLNIQPASILVIHNLMTITENGIVNILTPGSSFNFDGITYLNN